MFKVMIAAVVFGMAVAVAAAGPKPVKVEDVPVVAKAASAAAKGVEKWTFALESDGPDGKPAYRLYGKNGGGKVVMVESNADATKLNVFVEIKLDDVPADARNGVTAKHPTFKATSAMTVGQTDDVKKAVGYLYDGTAAGGKAMTVMVSGDGKLVIVTRGGEPAPKPAPATLPPPAAGPKELQGSWKVVEARRAWKAVAAADGDGGRLVVTGTTFELLGKDGAVLFSGTVTLWAGANTFDVDGPKKVDELFKVPGKLGDHARGIYELKGNELRLCYHRTVNFVNPGDVPSERPESFADGDGSEEAAAVFTDKKPNPNCDFLRLEKIEAKK